MAEKNICKRQNAWTFFLSKLRLWIGVRNGGVYAILDLRQNPESSIEPYNPKHFPQQQPLIGICLFLSTPPSLT
jgi:hypothetical protein